MRENTAPSAVSRSCVCVNIVSSMCVCVYMSVYIHECVHMHEYMFEGVSGGLAKRQARENLIGTNLVMTVILVLYPEINKFSHPTAPLLSGQMKHYNFKKPSKSKSLFREHLRAPVSLCFKTSDFKIRSPAHSFESKILSLLATESCSCVSLLSVTVCSSPLQASPSWILLPFKKKKNYLTALGLTCSMWDLVPWSGIDPQTPCFGITES